MEKIRSNAVVKYGEEQEEQVHLYVGLGYVM